VCGGALNRAGERVPFTWLCKWLRDILINGWLRLPPQCTGIECINMLNTLKYGLIVHKIGISQLRLRNRGDSNHLKRKVGSPTVPSESIHTPWCIPHFVVLQPEFKMD
jgi:hypothetical protein